MPNVPPLEGALTKILAPFSEYQDCLPLLSEAATAMVKRLLLYPS
jgi:hypothetical protein